MIDGFLDLGKGDTSYGMVDVGVVRGKGEDVDHRGAEVGFAGEEALGRPLCEEKIRIKRSRACRERSLVYRGHIV